MSRSSAFLAFFGVLGVIGVAIPAVYFARNPHDIWAGVIGATALWNMVVTFRMIIEVARGH
jgi:hypothetical protein